MTVSELIDHLEKLPLDLQVIGWDTQESFYQVQPPVIDDQVMISGKDIPIKFRAVVFPR